MESSPYQLASAFWAAGGGALIPKNVSGWPTLAGLFFARVGPLSCPSSLRGKELEDLLHHALSLTRLKEILSVRGTIQNNQRFWFGSFLVLRPNPGKTWSISARIVAGHDEQCGGLELFGRTVRRSSKEHYAIDLPWLRSD